MEYVLLLIGFIIIIKASDILVDSASSIATKFNVPKTLIALTIVAFGTCAPEIAISFNSVMNHNGSMAIANVIGSCIINVVLVIGIATFTNPIKVKHVTIRKELPLLVFITFIFSGMVLDSLFNPYHDNILSRFDGVVLLLLFSLFVVYLIRMYKKSKQKDDQEPAIAKYGVGKSILYIILCLVAIFFSGELLVDNAIIIAENLGISQKIITMIVIVIGTSTPELVMTITSARKKEHEIAIGNIIGTNIFNICIVMGLPITIFGGFQIIDFSIIDMIVLLTSSVLLYFFSRSEHTVTKKEGIIMIAIFIAYYGYLILY